MSVRLEPVDVLTFKRPLTRTTKEILKITNPSNQDIAFKVKTTAPKLYCVRPNAGIVPAGAHLEVQVMLQPFKEEPPLDQKCKDKFLVQTVPMVNELESFELADLWPHVESNAKELVQQIKLRCNYVDENEEKASHPNHNTRDMSMESDRISTTESTLAPSDDGNKLQAELDALKSELMALRESAPAAKLESTVVKKNGVPLPLVVVIALLAFLIPFVLHRQSA
ncbi:PapD-like protein [Chlamydoabsidia padenii]|nr:PapD-like protein [Chlamydoabsidia padenii]